MSGPAGRLPEQPFDRPIRVVVFGGAFFEPAALEFVAMLDENPEIDLAGGFCQSRGFALRHRVADIVRRRTLLAPAVLAVSAAQTAGRFLRRPRGALALRRRVRGAMTRMRAVPDIHAPEVLQQVRALSPDLGLCYGAPRLKAELFDIPAFGTLGIHHGRLPDYRGKKTTFWEMFNGETVAGVSIQRINAGLDAGEIVCTGQVPIAGKRYGRLDRDVQRLGLTLFVRAILAVRRGEAQVRPQPRAASRLYRQPGLGDVVRLWWRQLPLGRRGGR
jgi:folate-dependent phosphoribosylglycinamide formyltransferase PurN